MVCDVCGMGGFWIGYSEAHKGYRCPNHLATEERVTPDYPNGSIINHGGAEYAVTAKGYVNITTGDIYEDLPKVRKTELIRLPFGLEIRHE